MNPKYDNCSASLKVKMKGCGLNSYENLKNAGSPVGQGKTAGAVCCSLQCLKQYTVRLPGMYWVGNLDFYKIRQSV